MSTAPESWSIDPIHSSAEFELPHLGFGFFRGKFRAVEGKVNLTPTNQLADAKAVIEVSSIDAVNEGLRNAVLGKDFFAADQHPKIEFQSASYEPKSERHGTLKGTLSMRGQSKPVSFEVERLAGEAVHPFTKKTMLAFRAQAAIRRSEWGFAWNVPLSNGGTYLGDEVRITLHVEVAK